MSEHKLHFIHVSAFRHSSPDYTNCGKKTSGHVCLTIDPLEITCYTCLRIEIDSMESEIVRYYEQMAKIIRETKFSATDQESLRNCIDLVDSLKSLIGQMEEIRKRLHMENYHKRWEGR